MWPVTAAARIAAFVLALFLAYTIGRAVGIGLGIGPYITEAVAIAAVLLWAARRRWISATPRG